MDRLKSIPNDVHLIKRKHLPAFAGLPQIICLGICLNRKFTERLRENPYLLCLIAADGKMLRDSSFRVGAGEVDSRSTGAIALDLENLPSSAFGDESSQGRKCHSCLKKRPAT